MTGEPSTVTSLELPRVPLAIMAVALPLSMRLPALRPPLARTPALQTRQVERIAANDRQFGHAARVHDQADVGRGRLEQLRLPGHFYRFGDIAEGFLEALHFNGSRRRWSSWKPWCS